MFRRVSQPPVNPGLRDPERHGFWLGCIVALAGVALAYCGSRHVTAIETVDGGIASETQLMKAYSTSGLQFPDQIAPPPPPKPEAGPEALALWARQTAKAAEPPRWKVRVDTSAKEPCPT
jgi:hypothetical protein